METFKDVISGDQLVLVDFFATWCQPCKMMHPILEQVKEVLGDRIHIIKVDVDKYGITASQYGIQSVPTLMLFRRGEMLWRTSGIVQKSELLAAIDPFLKIIINKSTCFMNRNIIFQDNGLFGLKHQTGEIIISPQYIEMYDFKCGLSMVRNAQYQYAYIDINNKQVVPFGKYSWLDSCYVCGFARVMSYDHLQGKEVWGIIDTLGNIVVPLIYDKIWALKEEYLFSIKAFKGDKEECINLHKMQPRIIFDDLKYISVYSVEEFKQLTNCEKIYVKLNPKDNKLFFTYGANIGRVAVTKIPKEPIIAIVSNSSGKIFPLLLEKTDLGKTFLPLNKAIIKKQASPKNNYHRTSFWDYEAEKMNDADNWSNPYGDEQVYYDGWNREEVENGLYDAYEGDIDARWNND